MSQSRILGLFCKSGIWSRYSRRFHALGRDAKELALQLIQNGIEPDKAIKRAKRTA